MSIEAQYYSIPLAVAVGFILSLYLAYRIIERRQLPTGTRIALWLIWVVATCGLLAALGVAALIVFFVFHPMDPAFPK
jgi:hypothetical protein